MAIDPRKWIYDFTDKVPAIIRDPARWIADRIFGGISDGVAFAVWLKSAFQALYTKGVYYVNRVENWAREQILTITWLIDVEIPRRVADVLTKATAYAARVVNKVRADLTALISSVRSWAATQINNATAFARDLRDWATSRINALNDKMHKTVDVWYDRLTHPDVMAEWLIGALVSRIGKYVYDRREKIAKWLFNDSGAAFESLARIVDNVLRKLL